MSRRRPPGTKSVERTWKEKIVAADPDFEAEARAQVEYEFSNGRTFSGITAKRGVYADDEE